MNTDPEQHMVVMRLASDWLRQAKENLERLRVACGGTLPASVRDAQPYDPEAFSLFVEAYYALSGGRVSDEIVKLAGLVPVDQALSE